MGLTATMTRPRAKGVLAEETLGAWAEYLHATQGQPEARYEEVEPWAWSRLQAVLRAIQTRRRVTIEDSPCRTDAAEGSSPAGGDEVPL